MHPATADQLEHSLFTTSNPLERDHCCVVAIDKLYAVSFSHGQHTTYKKDKRVMLYNVRDPSLQLEAVVLTTCDSLDVIVFKLIQGTFPHYPRGFGAVYRGQSYKQLGVCRDREPSWKDGTISEKKFGFYTGTSHGKIGDSGSGIYDMAGNFIGLSVGKQNFRFANHENLDISEIADHHPVTLIITSEVIHGVWGVGGHQSEYKPPFKKVTLDNGQNQASSSH